MSIELERHWTAFSQEVPWFVGNRPNAKPTRTLPPGSWVPTSPEFTALFPALHDLLSAAAMTEIRLLSESWTLYSWDGPLGEPLRGWLSPARWSWSESALPPGLHPEHRVLLQSFPGIIEQFGCLETWILNHNVVLTSDLAQQDATFTEASAWAFEETGGIPVDLQAYYAVAEEANGNTTLCHRVDGDILLFAPDHDFDYVAVLDGCPELTFYRLQGAPTFAAWVNRIAAQWLASGARPTTT